MGSTYILVRDYLHRLNMAGGLEDLPENIFCNSWIKAADVQSSLVGLRGRSCHFPP